MTRETKGSFVGLLSGLLAVVLLLGICVSVAAYTMGWMTVAETPEQTTIEVDTAEMREAADEVEKHGEKVLEQTGEALQETGDQLKDAANEDDSLSDPSPGT